MRISIGYLTGADREFWFSLDRYISLAEFERKVREQMAYVMKQDERPIAILRYSLFWDSIPFCNMLYVENGEQHKGYGRALMEYWEQDMKSRGYDLVMTSTQSDESAQHFYRKLGYREIGGMMLPFPGYEQPMELILAKMIDFSGK